MLTRLIVYNDKLFQPFLYIYARSDEYIDPDVVTFQFYLFFSCIRNLLHTK